MKTLAIVRSGTIALLLCVQTSALAVTFTHDSFISFADPSYDGQDIVVTNCTLTVDGPHTFNSVQLVNGGVLTHSPFPYGPQLFTVSVFDEPQILTSTNAVALDNIDVDSNSIVVTDTTGTITYAKGLAYTITVSNNVTLLTLTPQSGITSAAVLVSYDWTANFQGFDLTINNNLQIDATSSIDVSGKGYTGGLGFQTGAGGNQSTNFPFVFTAGGGGAHGGAGGMSSTFARGGATYDSITNPASLGSGGGLGTQLGGAGGGAALLTVGGNLQIDGQILANGFKGTNAHSGGGAGGSIFISAASLAGAGTIAANGGGGDLPDGGGGGGGRVAINFGTNTFTGNTTAFGGNGANAGGAGTVFMRSSSSAAGQLFIINGGHRGTNTPFSTVMVTNLTISGGAVAQSLSATLAVTNLFIGSNSWLTVTDALPLTINVANNATIESNATINADAKSTSGPGTGIFTGCGAGAGGSYGGFGGNSVCGAGPGNVYGLMLQPTAFGSPGTFNGGGTKPAARGGGVIQLNVGGTLSLAGNISANGEAAAFAATGAGSGGSVWLNVGTLLGGGTISANGGSASNLVSGGGGGGRVAVYYNSNALTGSIQAYGGSGTNNGGPGTIYLKNNIGFPASQLIVDNSGRVGSTLINYALNTGQGIYNVQISGGAAITNYLTARAEIANLFIGSNSWFVVSSPAPAQGTLSLEVYTNTIIQASGGITADGASSSTAGAGTSLNLSGGGGANGGNGGVSYTNAQGGIASGSITSPINPGGIGGAGLSIGGPNNGGKGGGVISLNTRNLQLDGTITANGITGPGFNSGGGGGGSIELEVASLLSGAGTITANGGMANAGGGGGGGGRIAVTYGTNLFTGAMSAHGGTGANNGGAGTVFVAHSPSNLLIPTQLTIDNGGSPGGITPLPSNTLLNNQYNLTISGGASVSNASATQISLANLFVGSNSVFQSFPSGVATISVTSNITVQAGGSINGDGVAISSQGGAGQSLISTGGGGGNAGSGGNSAIGALGGTGFSTSITSPSATGGQGGAGTSINGGQNAGGKGGGALQISAGQTLRVDGRISVDGGASPSLNGGGGAGGSLALSCRTFSGSGAISANGGAANGAGGGGGGGRIAITLSTNAFTGSITAHGGSGANYGGAGFIYAAVNPSPGVPPIRPFPMPASPFPLLAVDNGGVQGGMTPLLVNPPENVNLTVTGGAFLTNNAGFSIQSLLIGSNSTWFVSSGSSLSISVQTNATIQSGGRLTLDGTSVSATGMGQTLINTGGGGGHGGYGGASLSNALGGIVSTDPITSPMGLGGRGGGGNPITGGGSTGGNGGGALELIVRGALQLDGSISADGLTSPSLNGGGGAGGSVWLQAGKLSGAGVISANGGPGNNIGGGGAGGRVALWYNTNAFAGSITARGGAGANYGGAGTIYTVPSISNVGRGSITIDNRGPLGTNTPISNLTGTSGPDLVIGSGASVTVSTLTSFWNSLMISSNASLSLDPAINTLTLTISSNMTIQTGGTISLTARGFAVDAGPGQGSVGDSSSGASHGGMGSAGSVSNIVKTTYDSINNPSLPGSGGGSIIVNPPFGSAGGGALHLTVNGVLTVNGSIVANGGNGISKGAGGGAGGSIWLTTGTFSGTGGISANGGDGDFFGGGGGGGGGRIAVYFNTNRFSGTYSATGGAGPMLAGGAGTIYLKTNFSNAAQLILDNGGQPGADTPLIQTQPLVNLFITNGAVADAATSLSVQNLFIGQGGVFSADNSTLLNLTVNANAVIGQGGAIDGDLHLAAGPGLGAGSVDLYGDGSGGGYGGAGGASMFGAPGGTAYGSSDAPTNLGSAGGSLPTLAGYSQGGGAVRLNVNGRLTVDGSITANGNDGIIDGSGGGSGGSIWITAQSIFGSGSLTANGGMGESMEGGGGGGGRIAVLILTNLFAGNLVAAGGEGAFPGQDGTALIVTNLIISGIVTDTNGTPVVGMVVQPNLMPSAVTDFNGFYFVTVPPFWSGTLGPGANSLSIPAIRTYSNLITDAPNQDFTVVPTTTTAFNLMGGQFDGTNLNFNYYGIYGVTYTLQCSTNLIDWVPYCAAVQGSNAVNAISVPMLINNPPQLYFRLNASY